MSVKNNKILKIWACKNAVSGEFLTVSICFIANFKDLIYCFFLLVWIKKIESWRTIMKKYRFTDPRQSYTSMTGPEMSLFLETFIPPAIFGRGVNFPKLRARNLLRLRVWGWL